MPLEQADLIRNYVFMHVPIDQQDKFDEDTWAPFEATFTGTEYFEPIDITAFYRDYLMSIDKYVKKDETYVRFTEHVKKTGKSPQEIADELNRYGRFYSAIHRATTTGDPRITEGLKRIGDLDISTSYPLLLYLFDRQHRGVLSSEELLISLRYVESFVIRRSICEESTRPYSRWFPLAVRDIKGGLENNLGDTPTLLSTFLNDKGWPTDEQFKKALLTFELYSREPDKCRLILEELEKSYSHKEPVDLKAPRIEIEHVMPQTLSEEWKITLGGEWQRVYGTYLHTLGNLTLSGYNQELYNDPFLKKKDRLAKSNLQLNSYFAIVDVWDEAAVVARASKLAEEVAKIWDRPESSPTDTEEAGHHLV